MSNDADNGYGPTPPGAGYEHTDIDPGVGYRFALWLGRGDGAVGARSSTAPSRSWAAAPPISDDAGAHVPARRRAGRRIRRRRGCRPSPSRTSTSSKSEQRGALHSYGWVDQASGVVHIPIDHAMALTLQRGLPARAGGSAAPAMVVQDSSAGRTSAPR